MLLLLLITVTLPAWCFGGDKIHMYAIWNEEKSQIDTVAMNEGIEFSSNHHVAKAEYYEQINTTGWAFLELETNQNYSNKKQAHAAGYLEGTLTHELIWMTWKNTMEKFCDGRSKTCRRIDEHIKENNLFIERMDKKMNATDPYWNQISLVYDQIKGIYYGYNNRARKSKKLTYNQILWLNLNGDLEDLLTKFGGNKSGMPRKEMGYGRCSALVKVLENTTDILVGHTTWTVYETMIRIQKKYTFHYKLWTNSTSFIPTRSISMSSYPGYVHSADDFYILSSGMVAIETTISNDNSDLLPKITLENQVLEFVRTMVANRLATKGSEWATIFSKYNSGTYNNQWMVVDYNRFKPGYPLKSGVLWVLEQLPGYVQSKDLTDVLSNQKYFASYNTPYFKDVFNMSGQWPMVEKYGDWFTYEKTPRALIFKREQEKVKNIDDMMSVMRYNNFKNDPLSRCDCTPPYSGENAIAARSDLNLQNGTYTFPALSYRNHGASDAKVTNRKLSKSLAFHAVSSPPFDEANGVPPFQWSKAEFGTNTPHLGQPDLWNFKPLTHMWHWWPQ